MINPLFTVVIPMYNVEKFLGDCLLSIVNQTYKNFDVILVDDGSTDNTSNIAKKYVKKYKYIKYIRQKNKGLGGARNTGFKYSTGDYTIFLDSDDFIATKSIENLTNYITRLGDLKPDIILTAPVIYNNVTKSYSDFFDKSDLFYIYCDKSIANVGNSPELQSLEPSFWRCIWNTNFLRKNKLKFLEHVKWEDVPPHFSLFHVAKTITKYSENNIFFYRINTSNQITNGTGKSRLDVPIVFNKVFDQMEKEQWPLYERLNVYKGTLRFTVWSINSVDDEYRKELIRSMHKLFLRIPRNDFHKYILHFKDTKKGKSALICLRSRILCKILYTRVLTSAIYRIVKGVKR